MNELKVSLENIIPLTYARDHFSQIVAEVQKDKLFVLTKGGKPAVAIMDVKYLESITGGQIQKADIKEEIKKAPEKVGLPPMVEHKETPPPGKSEPPAPSKPAGFASPLPPKPTPPTPVTPPPKPAGFAAPQPPKPQEEKPVPPAPTKIEPKSNPPAPAKIEPSPQPAPPPAPKPPAKEPEELIVPKEPVVSAPAGTANKPLVNLPPVQEKDLDLPQVDVEFTPDDETMAKKELDGKIPDELKTDPDDLKPPAQYAGDETENEAEPEDMALD